MSRIRIIFRKSGWITFVNHMDLPTALSRAARRAGLSQEFTQGYSPHPHISLGPPLAIGVEGRAEAAEFWFNQWDESSAAKWNLCLPEGIEILRYREVDGPALAKQDINSVTKKIVQHFLLLMIFDISLRTHFKLKNKFSRKHLSITQPMRGIK